MLRTYVEEARRRRPGGWRVLALCEARYVGGVHCDQGVVQIGNGGGVNGVKERD